MCTGVHIYHWWYCTLKLGVLNYNNSKVAKNVSHFVLKAVLKVSPVMWNNTLCVSQVFLKKACIIIWLSVTKWRSPKRPLAQWPLWDMIKEYTQSFLMTDPHEQQLWPFLSSRYREKDIYRDKFVELSSRYYIDKKDSLIRSVLFNVMLSCKWDTLSAWYFDRMKLINRIIAALIWITWCCDLNWWQSGSLKGQEERRPQFTDVI